MILEIGLKICFRMHQYQGQSYWGSAENYLRCPFQEQKMIYHLLSYWKSLRQLPPNIGSDYNCQWILFQNLDPYLGYIHWLWSRSHWLLFD